MHRYDHHDAVQRSTVEPPQSTPTGALPLNAMPPASWQHGRLALHGKRLLADSIRVSRDAQHGCSAGGKIRLLGRACMVGSGLLWIPLRDNFR